MKSNLLFLLILPMIGTTAQPAPWVSYPSANQTAYGFYYFRRTFYLEKVPENWLPMFLLKTVTTCLSSGSGFVTNPPKVIYRLTNTMRLILCLS